MLLKHGLSGVETDSRHRLENTDFVFRDRFTPQIVLGAGKERAQKAIKIEKTYKFPPGLTFDERMLRGRQSENVIDIRAKTFSDENDRSDRNDRAAFLALIQPIRQFIKNFFS